MLVDNYVDDARDLIRDWGVQQVTEVLWAFTDVATASHSYVHHSSWPAALCAYAAVDPVFARGRFPGRTLIELVHKVPSMDGAERTALAIVSGGAVPTFDADKAPQVFGKAVWNIIATYELEELFERDDNTRGNGDHHKCRPRGIEWSGSWDPIPSALKAMRKAYRSMDLVRQVMALTILHLYLTRPDKQYLIGGCPTQILAADALDALHRHGRALPQWGHLIAHYRDW